MVEQETLNVLQAQRSSVPVYHRSSFIYVPGSGVYHIVTNDPDLIAMTRIADDLLSIPAGWDSDLGEGWSAAQMQLDKEM